MKSQEEYNEKIKAAFTVARMLIGMRDDLMRISQNIDKAEAVGCFIDPTLYMRGIDALQEHKAIVHALLAAANEIEPARDRLLNALLRLERATAQRMV